ncbi:response regulator transcription factor [Novosphingobium aerophilum]|uniref:response regulator transcription factor n=1 Tax=Novosphingobium TaxID=165696 RepID=UPI0012BF887F|nr:MULTISPECIES: response regulator transcription factor [unclassified Novosphingobium]MPS68139.1 response regulator transcription factor [Novosphingobium sp.]WRT95287.1 response regulator transcription factor [Novosphingobium sp. RL4]
MRIAILEDDLALAGYVEKSLLASGNSCAMFADGQNLLHQMHRETFDMLILDWNVPGMSGLQILDWMRENLDSRPPSLMLTSRSAEEDIVAGLSAGADDYVIKPVSSAVLLARVAAVARRAYPTPTNPVETFGPFRFDSRAETIELLGEAVAVTAKEFALATLLFRNMNRALSRAYLLEAIWGVRPNLPTRTLDAHISNVRTKLNLRPANGFKLSPIYSYGYRLEALT